ncbi:MAG TPA: ATP-binding cassette domain-containing protein, partial [Opitutaceae bacterium]|nr:ATP-binding cassette domain-containing protein [Opitutaceae bacterium]
MTQEAPSPVIELEGVDKRFGGGPLILDKIGISARRGDFVTLIGPSGCGKSTVLRLIAGLIPASAGRITVDGAPAGTVEKLAFVFQEPTLLPWLSVLKNVEVPQRLHGAGRAQRSEIARRSLELVGLSDRTGYFPRQLSGGQKMR